MQQRVSVIPIDLNQGSDRDSDQSEKLQSYFLYHRSYQRGKFDRNRSTKF